MATHNSTLGALNNSGLNTGSLKTIPMFPRVFRTGSEQEFKAWLT